MSGSSDTPIDHLISVDNLRANVNFGVHRTFANYFTAEPNLLQPRYPIQQTT